MARPTSMLRVAFHRRARAAFMSGASLGLNQSPPYVDVDLYGSDLPLQSAVAAHGAGADASALAAFARRWGSADMFDAAREANENPPRLHAFDARGFRLDQV